MKTWKNYLNIFFIRHDHDYVIYHFKPTSEEFMDLIIVQHCKRRIPKGLCVTKKSTTIPFFGNYELAKACTISLNPSNKEFLNNHGEILTGDKARLVSRKQLKCKDNEMLSKSDAIRIIDKCSCYFNKGSNPYKSWFNRYEAFLKIFGYSYYEDSAVGLDIVQWATTPFWKSLKKTPAIIKELLRHDIPFLKYLLTKRFDRIFLNGITVVEAVQDHLKFALVQKDISFLGKRRKIYFGYYNNSKVIGWSTYLQSSRFTDSEIQEFAKVILALAPCHIAARRPQSDLGHRNFQLTARSLQKQKPS